MPLHIYTASAGAGKTHTLTREYLRLALSSPDPRYFTSIQAVTFTKKATGEMKERITAALDQLAHDPHRSPFLTELQQELQLTEGQLQRRALATLRAMLLDYNAFRVRTIDSFFQEVVRSFAHELGHAGLLRVELNTDPHLRQAVLEVLSAQDESGASATIRQWIEQLLQESIREGKKFSSLERRLSAFARELEDEAVKLLRAEHQFPTKEAVEALRQTAAKQREALVGSIQSQAQAILQLLASQGIEDAHLLYKERGPMAPIRKLERQPAQLFEKGVLVTDSVRLRAYLDADDPADKLLGKDAGPEVRSRLATIAVELKERTRQLVDSLPACAPLLETTNQLLRYADLYGLLIDIDTALQQLKQEGSMMFLSDAPSLISSLLRDGTQDAPFLYEKIGARIAHHMIDEFQDTSRMQYTNFRPLLENSLADGKDCLIVGDAKQSIYRFRNSDSSLLTLTLSQDFARHASPHLLAHNWRSAPEIIAFNNALYTQLPRLLQATFLQLWTETSGMLQGMEDIKESLLDFLASQLKAYEDVQQLVPEGKTTTPAGQVVLHRFYEQGRGGKQEAPSEAPAEEEAEEVAPDALDQLPHVLIDLQKRGYKASDIAILVRRRATAVQVADVLQHYTGELPEGCSLHFVSEEALAVGGASSVRFLIACLSYVAEPQLPIRQAILCELYSQLREEAKDEAREAHPDALTEAELEELLLLGRRGLYEVVESLIHRFRALLPEGESAYVVKLLDLLYRWEQDQSADIAAFLTYWEEKGKEERIVSAASDDAVQLMTIHKSKGLGFPVVLLPDLAWPFDPSSQHENILWCPFPELPEVAPFRASGISSVPLRYSSSLGRTFFASAYYEEYLRYRLDELNLLYVATTRPKQELHLWLPEVEEAPAEGEEAPKSKKKTSKKSVDGKASAQLFSQLDKLLLQLLRTEGEGLPWKLVSAAEAPHYAGLLPAPPRSEGRDEEVITLDALTAYPLDERLAVLREGLDYFTEESQRRYGRTMHLILSHIERAEELPEALAEAVRQGYITEEQTAELSPLLGQILTHSDTQRWFDGSGRVLNEQAIIGGGLPTSRRPDRIVLYPDGSVEVVDYKFGQPSARYFTQVRRYMELLRAMGYEAVRGYLCYLREEGLQVVSVPLQRPTKAKG